MTDVRQGRNEKAQQADVVRRAVQEAQWKSRPGFTLKDERAVILWQAWVNEKLAHPNRNLISTTIQWATALEDTELFAARAQANLTTFLRQPDTIRREIVDILSRVWAYGEEFAQVLQATENA